MQMNVLNNENDDQCYSHKNTETRIQSSDEMLKFPLVVDVASELVRASSKEVEAVRLAVSLLQQGEVVALPTDTIYGIACDVQNFEALQSLYRIKTRDKNKPIAICVGNVDDVSRWGVTGGVPHSVLRDLLPGPVTVLLRRTDKLNPELNSFTDKVGIRVPNCPFVLSIANALGRPLALTSANISNDPSPLSVEELYPIRQHLAAVFDGGLLGIQPLHRAGSTIVDLSVKGHFKITREGSALSETIEKLLKHGLIKFEHDRIESS